MVILGELLCQNEIFLIWFSNRTCFVIRSKIDLIILCIIGRVDLKTLGDKSLVQLERTDTSVSLVAPNSSQYRQLFDEQRGGGHIVLNFFWRVIRWRPVIAVA